MNWLVFLGALIAAGSLNAHADNQSFFSCRNQDGMPLHQFEEAIVQVLVTNAKYDICRPFSVPKESQSSGSAFFIDPILVNNQDGYLLTNFHVIQNARFVEIQVPSSRSGKERFAVSIESIYPERDLALIALVPAALDRLKSLIGSIPYLSLGSSQVVQRGDLVAAFGYPLGQEGLKLTRGIISGRERLHEQGEIYLQIDAAVNRGNSGGPSLNQSGEVIGINTCAPHPEYHPGVQNIAYIIPIDDVRPLLPVMMKQRRLYTPFWGIRLSNGSKNISQLFNVDDGFGAYIASVHPEGILYKNGVRSGMILKKINGYVVDYYGELIVPWSLDKISALDFLNCFEHGALIELELVSYEKSLHVYFEREPFSFFQQPGALSSQLIYPCHEIERIDYEAIAGMVFMECTINHMRHFSLSGRNSLHAQEDGIVTARDPSPANEDAYVILSSILPSTIASAFRSLRSGMIVININGIRVTTLADVRKALLRSKETGLLIVGLADGSLMVSEMSQIAQSEQGLINYYHYKPSIVFTTT